LIGTTVLIQGTTQGTITNFDGEYVIPKVNPGTYNLVISFISYESKVIRIEVENDKETEINVALDPATLDIGEVQVVAKKRTDTDMSMISNLKAQNLIVSGISAQQISRSQDKDAAEVIRRVPGITITDGRFVIVRGLIERYNSVMLNNATAPSFEADKRAFSFDAIPSGLIDNILIYKSPSPELPADFAGAAIDVETKSVADENSLVISYGNKYVQNTSFSKEFETYKGSKTDWLGFDDGTRKVPGGVPGAEEFTELYNWENIDAYKQKTDEITRISKLFSNNWESYNKKPLTDQDLSITSQRRFVLGKISVGNITSFNYGFSSNYIKRDRLEYQGYDEATGIVTKDFDFKDQQSAQSAKLGLIHNWNFLYGKNQKLEIRNFFNHLGTSYTNVRNGVNYYNVETLRLYDLKFVSRMVYSGQFAGEQRFNQDRTKVNWMAGYGLTKTDQPDNRRITFVLNNNESSSQFGRYYMRIQNVPNAYLGGRLWLDMKENIFDYKIDIEHVFHLFGSQNEWKAKAGYFYERKFRDFGSRLIGTVAVKNPPVDFYQPVHDIMIPDNFFFDQTPPYNQHGLSYRDNTRAKDSYNARDYLNAGYLALNIPITNKINLYGGIRIEKFNRLITNFYEPTPTPELYDIVRDTTDFFPSANLTYNITEKHVLRASFGKTVNRPEFREMSNFDYQDFDMFVLIHGNEDLQNAYVNNYDFRYEWYPQLGEIISVAGFYKQFQNPIEIFLIPAGTGYDYKPFNTENGYSVGIELDVRKRLGNLEAASGFSQFLKDITLIFNTSLIKSKINTEKQEFAREKNRVMQGQSPYIVNLGLNYSGENNGLSVNVSYNRIGKRIAYVGTPVNPHTWELPRNSLDLSLQKNLGERFSIKAGIKDVINDPVRFVQYYGSDESIELNTLKYVPNRLFSFSVIYKL
jgi:TonB-dependent receptor